MSITKKLMPYIKAQNLSFEEFSFMLGANSNSLYQKIERGNLGVKEAYAICEILKLKAPSDIFF